MGSVDAGPGADGPAARTFTVSYDAATKWITLIVCALLAGLTVRMDSMAFAALSAAVVGLAFAYSPRGYVVSPDRVSVRRWIGPAFFPLRGVRQARPVAAGELRGTIRLWGSGGLFGYYGLFWSPGLGRSTWYVTNRKKMVLVAAEAKTAIFSPDDAGGFIRSLGSVAGVADVPLAPVAPRRPGMLRWLPLALGAAALGLAALAFLYSPGPPELTLTRDRLEIHDRFYGVSLTRAEVDLAGVNVVDITPGSPWRPTARTNGFANSRYQSGWFRTANGRSVRLYRAGASRLVLIPLRTGGGAVLLQVAQPDEFVGRLRREWR